MPNAAQEILRAGDDASVALRVHADDHRASITRGELRRLVRQTAAALARRGVAEEQRVIVALPEPSRSSTARLVGSPRAANARSIVGEY